MASVAPSSVSARVKDSASWAIQPVTLPLLILYRLVPFCTTVTWTPGFRVALRRPFSALVYTPRWALVAVSSTVHTSTAVTTCPFRISGVVRTRHRHLSTLPLWICFQRPRSSKGCSKVTALMPPAISSCRQEKGVNAPHRPVVEKSSVHLSYTYTSPIIATSNWAAPPPGSPRRSS